MAFAVDQKAIHIKQHSFVMHEKLSFVLRQPIGDIVVIAFLADKNMNVGFYICRPVKVPHGNGCPVCFNDGIKKQVGPTGFKTHSGLSRTIGTTKHFPFMVH